MICPAYAGMILELDLEQLGFNDLSRVCGDDPIETLSYSVSKSFVPRMRG